MTAPCPNRDSCPCHGPIPVCYHGWAGLTFGTPAAVTVADGSTLTVYRVTAADCARCPIGKSAPGRS